MEREVLRAKEIAGQPSVDIIERVPTKYLIHPRVYKDVMRLALTF